MRKNILFITSCLLAATTFAEDINTLPKDTTKVIDIEEVVVIASPKETGKLREHTSFFLLRKPKTIVLAGGDNQPQLSGVPKLNIYQDEGSLIKDIHQLRQYGHQARKQAADKAMHIEKTEHELSVREIEVLILITKGLINKEIADKLNISLTTVISHRKNITEKLGIKSVSGLTVYAVMNGYIEADRI